MARRTYSRGSRSNTRYSRIPRRRTVARGRSSSRARRSARGSGARTVRLVIEQQPLQAIARPDGAFQVAMATPKRSFF